MTKPSSKRFDVLTLAVFLPFALAIFFMFVRASGEEPLTPSSYRVQAVVPTSVTLARNAEVRSAGVTIGHVEAVAERGRDTLLLLDLDADYAPIGRDSRVDVRSRTLVGENYVELHPGSQKSRRLPDGGMLPIDRAVETVQVDEVLSAFDRPTRQRLRRLLDRFGGGLRGHGSDLNRFFGAGSSLTVEGSPVFETLRAQRGEVAALVDDLGIVMRTLGERREDIRLLARRSGIALNALAERDEFVAQTLEALPATLEQAGSTAARLAEFSSRGTSVMRDMRLSFDALRPGIRQLRPAAASARRTMAALGRFANAAPPMLESLRRFSNSGAEAVPPLRNFFSQYNPLAAYMARYTRELGAWMGNLRSFTNAHDALGNLLRIANVHGPSTFVGWTPEMERAYQTLRDIGFVQEMLGERGNNAYPQPGEIEAPPPFRGKYPRLEPERP